MVKRKHTEELFFFMGTYHVVQSIFNVIAATDSASPETHLSVKLDNSIFYSNLTREEESDKKGNILI